MHTSISQVFGNYIWELTYTSPGGLVHTEQLYLKKGKFFIVNKSVLLSNSQKINLKRSTITISKIKINGSSVEFYKTNLKRSYSDVPSSLEIVDPDNISGSEGEGTVKYRRIAKLPSALLRLLRLEFRFPSTR